MPKVRVLLIVAVAIAAVVMAGGAALAEQAGRPKAPAGKAAAGAGRANAVADPRLQRQANEAQRQVAQSAKAEAVQARGAGALSKAWSSAPGKGSLASASAPGAGNLAALSVESSPIEAPSAGTATRSVSSPTIANGAVQIGGRDGTLRSLDLGSGALLWNYSAGGWIESSPRVVDGKTYFTSRDGYLHAVNPDGSPYRKVQTGGADVSSVASDGSLLFFGSGYPNRDVFAVRASDGAIQWRFQTGQMVYSSPVVSDGTVYVGSNDGKYYALDARSGALRWSFATKGNIYRASPAVDGAILYAAGGGKDPYIYAVDARSGAELARFDVGGGYVSSPVVSGGLIYIQSADLSRPTLQHASRIMALSYSKGGGFQLAWQAPTGFAMSDGFASTPVVADSLVYAGSGDGNLYCFDAAGGPAVYFDTIQAGDGAVSSPAVSGQTLVVGDRTGKVHAIRQSTKKN